MVKSIKKSVKGIKDKLPTSDSKHRAWWGNDGHIQVAVWLQADWRVHYVELGNYVEFVKSVNIT
jgi:hypothetical protein